MEPRFITAKDMCEYLSISSDKLKDLVAEGTIPPPIALSPKIRRFDRVAVVQALTQKALGNAPLPMAESADTHARMMEALDELDQPARRAKGRASGRSAERRRLS